MTSSGRSEEEGEDRGSWALPRLSFLTLLLLVLIVYVPNQIHFPTTFGAKGLNVLNVLLLVTLASLLLRRTGTASLPPCTVQFAMFWMTIILAFWVSQWHGDIPTDVVSTRVKTVLTYMSLYFIFYLGVEDIDTGRLLMGAMLFVTAVASLEAAREGLDYGIGPYNVTHRASGPFGVDYREANRAGVFYAMFVPSFLSIALFYRSRPWLRMLAVGAFALGCFAILVTYSRQAYYLLAAAVAVLAARKSLVLAGVCAIALAFNSYWLPAAATERLGMTTTVDASGEELLDPSVGERYVIWEGARGMIASHPLGVGLARFGLELSNYVPISGMDAHNQYLLTCAETGIQGLAAYLLLLLGLGGLARRLIRGAEFDGDRALAWAYAVALLNLVLGGVYGSPVFFGEVMGNFWALSGIVAREVELRDLERAFDEAEEYA